jgi:elongation factor P
MEVIETEPGARGDTVSNVTKPAKLQSGLEVKVPAFVKEGDKVKVDTRTGEYLERAN